MSADSLKKEFVSKYKAAGEPNKFYRSLLFYALNRMVLVDQKQIKEKITPDVIFLDCHDQFLVLYRREGEAQYLDIARAFRRAGHKIYRVMRRKNMIPFNSRFLNVV